MRALAFSDIHTSETSVRALAGKLPADILIGAGDFATMRRGLEPIIQAIAEHDLPTILVHGNAESEQELRDACDPFPHLHVLHGTSIEIGGRTFFGLGAAVPVTPFGSWSVDLTERQAAKLLRDCPHGAVLVSHSPPHGCCDVASSGRSLGSTAVRACVERTRPTHVLCGHIHNAWGQVESLGDARVLNLGPAGVSLDLE